MLVAGMQAAKDEVELGGCALKEVMDVPGVETFFEALVTQSGHGNGAAFELRCISELLFDLKQAHLADPHMLVRLQVPMLDGRDGPDMLWVYLDEAVLVQAKSYADLSKLIAIRSSNELLGQLDRDIRRLKAQGFTVEVEPGKPRMKISPTVHWRIDWMRIEKEAFATAEQMAKVRKSLEDFQKEVNDTLKDPHTKELLGLDPSDPDFQVVLEFVL